MKDYFVDNSLLLLSSLFIQFDPLDILFLPKEAIKMGTLIYLLSSGKEMLVQQKVYHRVGGSGKHWVKL